MKPNYRSELDATLVQKHLTRLQYEDLGEKLTDLTMRARALSTLSDDPYSFQKISWSESNLKMELTNALHGLDWKDGGPSRGLFGGYNHAEEVMARDHKITNEDLVTYTGVLIDLMEITSEENPISSLRFHLRVYYSDDVKAFVGMLKETYGK